MNFYNNSTIQNWLAETFTESHLIYKKKKNTN